MKIAVISLNLSGGQAISNFLTSKKIDGESISSKYFYDYDQKELGHYSEDINGLKLYIDEIYDQYDCFVEFPVSFGFKYLAEKNPETKFIYVQRTPSSWIDQMNTLKISMNYETPFYFEELFCNHYIKTGKVKINNLSDEELNLIYSAHNSSVLNYFENNQNFLLLNFADEDVFIKIQQFLNI